MAGAVGAMPLPLRAAAMAGGGPEALGFAAAAMAAAVVAAVACGFTLLLVRSAETGPVGEAAPAHGPALE